MDLENTDTPKYLGVTLDRTLSYKTHIHNTKMKVVTRNKLLKKLANSRWGTNARTIRTTTLALCYSTAEYAAPVWERSAYAHLLNPEWNQACRAITGCLRPTNVENLYLLAGIASPEIRRSVCARVERTKQVERETHSLFGHTPARRRLKSRRSFLTSVQPVHFPAKVVQVNEWKRRLEEKAHAGLVNLYEDLATGHDSPWLNWRCLNRLRTGYTCSKEQRKKWGYFNGDTTCECGLATENTSHMLQCTLLAHPCTVLGRPSRVQRYSSSMHRAMEKDSLVIRHDDDRFTHRTLAQLRTNKSPCLKSDLHKVDAKTHPSPRCPLCNSHTHDTHHLFNCTHIRTTLSPLDLWTDPTGVTALLADGPQAGRSDYLPLARTTTITIL